MAYKIVRFGDVILPHRMSTDDLGTGSVDSPLVKTLGGAFDVENGERRLPVIRRIRHQGLYVGSDDLDLQIKIDAIKAKLGTVDQLWRQRHDGVEQWLPARLLSVRHEVAVDEHFARLADMQIDFAAIGAVWRADTQTSISSPLGMGLTTVAVANGGAETVDDAIIHIVATSAISNVDIRLGSAHLIYGALVSGDNLAIDCGRLTVTVNGSDAYANFSPGTDHGIDGWLQFEPGSNSLEITIDGTANLTVQFYEQYI